MSTWKIDIADACQLPLRDQSVDLVLGSPPYTDRRTYGVDDIARDVAGWVPWMLDVTREALRVCRGPVVWIANGHVKHGVYRPAVEGLLWESYKAGLHVEHPLIWSKNAAPNRKNWWSNQWEFIICYYPEGWDHYFDWQAVATPRVCERPGGAFRMRGKNGKRTVRTTPLAMHPLARPYDILRATVGGGHMGHQLAHENEAPFPLSLAEPLVRALTRPGDMVLDPFSGSGTTCHAAHNLGRNSVGYDIRLNQVFLGRKRMRDVENGTISGGRSGDAVSVSPEGNGRPGDPAQPPIHQTDPAAA